MLRRVHASCWGRINSGEQNAKENACLSSEEPAARITLRPHYFFFRALKAETVTSSPPHSLRP
jgi:hypothetical protein